MKSSYKYLPIPPRVWSRVQNSCSLVNPISYSSSVYVPLLNQTVTPVEADYYDKLIAKGNVLQYKKNSSNLTQKQRYSQIAKGMWTNRTTTWATQSDKYTDPNTKYLKPSGTTPLEMSLSNSLLCNTILVPITGEIIVTKSNRNVNPTSDSDVPGTIQPLYWNPRLQTWYPRQRYIMTNSTDKWPVNYKPFVSAITPTSPTIVSAVGGVGYMQFSWTDNYSDCIPITTFAIYGDNRLLDTVNYPTTTYVYTLDNLTRVTTYSFYVVALSGTIPSEPSNTVTITSLPVSG